MGVVANVILWLYGAAIVAVIVLLIYLIYKRIQDKKTENFEDRDN